MIHVKQYFEQGNVSAAVANFREKYRIPLLYMFSKRVIFNSFSELTVTINNSHEYHYGYFRSRYENVDMCFVDTHAGINPFSAWVDLTDSVQNLQIKINHLIAILNGQGWSNLDFPSDLSTDFVGVEKVTSDTWDRFTINSQDKTIINTVPSQVDLHSVQLIHQSSFIAHGGALTGEDSLDIDVSLYSEDYELKCSIPFILVYLLAQGFDIQSPADLKYDWKKSEKDCLWSIAEEVYGGNREHWIFLF